MLCVAIIWLLARATLAGVPVSMAYVVSPGWGAAGAVLLGLVVHHDPATPMRLGALALITRGVLIVHAGSA